MNNSAFIYIPDISGFTKFVTETEISHSQHIISELIEIIINGNELNLTISEIEGDAVLFYKKGNPPEIKKILEQSENIFTKFHEHLALIKKNNVCQCGACQTASDLSLKFIGHYGELKEVAINSFNKIIGSDVILAHRLLKNSVSSIEYLLLSNSYLMTQNQLKQDGIGSLNFIENIEAIENFGDVSTKYVTLSHLKEKIKVPLENANDDSKIINSSKSVLINAPIKTVHGALIDIEAKLRWVPGINDILASDKINRVNTKHTCIFDGQSIDFITLMNKKKNDTINYSERVELKNGQVFDTNYLLKKEGSRTKLYFSFNTATVNENTTFNFVNRLKQKVTLFLITRKLNDTLVHFKNYCEKLTN